MQIHLPLLVHQVRKEKQSVVFFPQYYREEESTDPDLIGARKEIELMVLMRDSKIIIRQAQDVAAVFQGLLQLEDKIDKDKEHFYVMHLDSRQRINLVELVAIGTLNTATVHPRETYRRAVTEGTQSIIIAHNHPSGEVTPSDNDIRFTTQLEKAGEILGIPLLDHIIFTEKGFSSFRDVKGSFQETKTQSALQRSDEK